MTEYATYPSLRGQVAFVSGGATGLGAEFVGRLAAQGARVIFVDVQDEAGRALAETPAAPGLPPPLRRARRLFATQAVVPTMRAAGGGSVIDLGSISAHLDLMDLPVYITAKEGTEGLTRTLARELGPYGIRVNCVLPGRVMTRWLAAADSRSCTAQRWIVDGGWM